MRWFEKIIAVHTAVTDAVSHAQRIKSERYFVWQEEGAITGSTDLFTKQEFDPWKDDFETSLNNNEIAWFLNSVQFEEDTGFYHYEWVWEVLDG